MTPDFDKIVRAGGVYDTKKYRYIIDTSTKEIKRIPLDKLDTAAAKDSWVVIK